VASFIMHIFRTICQCRSRQYEAVEEKLFGKQTQNSTPHTLRIFY